MRAVSRRMLEKRLGNVAADLFTAKSYLAGVYVDGVVYQSSSCSLQQALRDAVKDAEELHRIGMRIWDEEKAGRK